MQRVVNFILIGLGSITWLLAFLFRGSIAPVTDVFEREFNATSSEIGFMSSVLIQIPSGIMVQFIKQCRGVNKF